MKTIAKCACLVLLAAWAGSALSSAQTNPPAASAPNPPGAAAKLNNRRFSGKILSVDVKAKTILLQGGAKAVIAVTDKTKILKAKKLATFDVLAANQEVSGIERLNADGIWQAESLNVGDPRRILTEPPPKVVIAPDKPK